MRKAWVIAAAGALAAGVLVAVPLLMDGGGAEDNRSGVEQAVVGAGVPIEEPTPERYVALGDSFVSGPGVQPQVPGACARSEASFPALVAAALDTADFVDASCGGARTVDLSAPQRSRAGEINAPQLDAVTAETTLITFGTLGGNDMGLVTLATFCVVNTCGPGLNNADGSVGDDVALAGIAEAEENLAAGIQQAKSTAPDAEIFVIGYGTYLPEGGCGGLPGITADEADYLQGMIDDLSDMLGDVAEQENVEFVDMRTIPGAAEHTVCAEPEKQWVRALQTWNDGTPFHPSACGMEASAQHVLNAIRTHRGAEELGFDDSCVSAGPEPVRNR